MYLHQTISSRERGMDGTAVQQAASPGDLFLRISLTLDTRENGVFSSASSMPLLQPCHSCKRESL
jgi:hypothetical protein